MGVVSKNQVSKRFQGGEKIILQSEYICMRVSFFSGNKSSVKKDSNKTDMFGKIVLNSCHVF